MSALDKQVGGAHYKKLKIQPVEYAHANELGFCEGSVVKYITRWRDKNGIADLEKAKHFIELLIQMETEAQAAQIKTKAIKDWLLETGSPAPSPLTHPLGWHGYNPLAVEGMERTGELPEGLRDPKPGPIERVGERENGR